MLLRLFFNIAAFALSNLDPAPKVNNFQLLQSLYMRLSQYQCLAKMYEPLFSLQGT